MNVWVLNAILIEAMALAGIIGVALTRRTKAAFAAGFNTMLLVTVVYVATAPSLGARQVLVLVMVVVYLVHMNWLLFFQSQHTAMAKLDAHSSLFEKYAMTFLLTNGVGWGYCLPFYFATRRNSPLNALDGIATFIYLIGTVIHWGSDYQKQRFKARPDSKGKLLTVGFWRWCRHPNYFGDFLIYVSFALISGSLWGWVAPVLNFLQYRFDAIPKNERWAAEHYGAQWEMYRRRVKMFIPFIY